MVVIPGITRLKAAVSRWFCCRGPSTSVVVVVVVMVVLISIVVRGIRIVQPADGIFGRLGPVARW